MPHLLEVVLQTPAHSAVGGPLHYRSLLPLQAGHLVRVPWGQRETLGVVWGTALPGDVPADIVGKLRHVSVPLAGLQPLSAAWLQLVAFAANYYQRSLGEIALAALPPALREAEPEQLARRLKRQAVLKEKSLKVESKRPSSATEKIATQPISMPTAAPDVALSAEQRVALDGIATNDGPFLLWGATGSGKTEVYLQAVERLLATDPLAQALVMVPEINLTPQLEARFHARFAPRYGDAALVSMHSGMTNPQRLNSWLAAHQGPARIVLGTRLAVYASMPHLKLIIVDEEHDPSYKQTEGARYSARDLAVWRGKNEGAKVLLGSATPSLESWHHAIATGPRGPKYQRLDMPSRIGTGVDAAASAGALPKVVRVDMNHQPKKAVISTPLLAAIQARAARGEQSMLLLNRRGYAPVLACSACEWKSECPHCSAYRVFHKIDRSLRCHHCGYAEAVPRACPECGNLDLQTVGRGTERLEEHLTELLAGTVRPGSESALYPQGEPLRIARIDADSTRLKGELERQLALVHAGDVDVLVGTQMIAKGHDFRRITLVAAINPDGALFSSDFRAPERLFSLLMQSAGRAGRDALVSGHSEMWIQSFYPQHPLFDALKRHDFAAFATSQLKERQTASLPPFSFQALVRAEARTQEVAQGFLMAAAAAVQAPAQQASGDEGAPAQGLGGTDTSALAALSAYVTLYPAVPLSIQRVANVERAQMLIECPNRARLQAFLSAWATVLHATRSGPAGKGLIRWAVDVDPLLI